MGWDYCESWRSKADVVAAQKREGRFTGYRLVAEATSRAGYWFLWAKPDGERWIECGLVAKDRASGCYGVKWMSADEHPYYYDAPLDWLDASGDESWKAEVRKYHERKAAARATALRAVPGSRVRVGGTTPTGATYRAAVLTVSAVRSRCLLAYNENGRMFRVPFAAVAEVLA